MSVPSNISEPPDRGLALSRWVFRIAGIYGVLILAPQYFLESRIGQEYPPPITHPENYYGFIGVALAWQVLFLIMSRDPLRYRPAMIPAILEKLSFGIAAIVLYVQGRLAAGIFVFGLIDLMLGASFVFCFLATRRTN